MLPVSEGGGGSAAKPRAHSPMVSSDRIPATTKAQDQAWDVLGPSAISRPTSQTKPGPASTTPSFDATLRMPECVARRRSSSEATK